MDRTLKRQNSLHDERGPVLKRKLARGPGGMLPRKVLKRRSSEITGITESLKSLETYILLLIFASSKLMRRAAKLHEKGHFSRVFEKWGDVPLVPPTPYVHALT